MWIVVGVAAWLAVATVVGVLIGRMVRIRDRQAPRDADAATPVTGIPAPTDGATPPRVVGRGRSRKL